jgi:hypothetical protein
MERRREGENLQLLLFSLSGLELLLEFFHSRGVHLRVDLLRLQR